LLGRTFTCLALAPGELAVPGAAIAAARAGGIGVLDVTRCGAEVLPELEARLRQLAAQTPADSTIGLRLGVAQLRRARPLLSVLASKAHVLLVRGRPSAPSDLESASGRERAVLAEVDSVEAAAAWQAAWPSIDGFVANGAEAAGCPTSM